MDNVIYLNDWKEKKLQEEVERLSEELDFYMHDMQIDVCIFDADFNPIPIGTISRSDLW